MEILIISHFSKNRGVTNYFTEYLEQIEKPYYYLRHPFNDESLIFSELVFFNGKEGHIIKKFKRSENTMFDLMRNFLVSFYVLFFLRKKVSKIISFGGFNVIPALIFKIFYNVRVIFWGVDYSTIRFKSFILNKLYLFFETISCKYATLVIQPTIRQQEVRIKNHKLNIKKSLIVPNGINFINKIKNDIFSDEIALIYIGSITKQHGVVDFVKFFYVKERIKFKLYIFGGGDNEDELKKIIKENSLSEKIVYFGSKNQGEIKFFIENSKDKLFGIAPYNIKGNDHVYYGDSIKIKEYLSYNIPFMTSSIAYVYLDIKRFGFIYKDFKELKDFFDGPINNFQLNDEKRNKILEKYLWNNIFNKLFSYL